MQNNNNRVTVKRKSLQLFPSGGHHSKLNLPEGFTWDVLPDTTLAFIQNWDWHKGVTWCTLHHQTPPNSVLFWKYAPFLLGTRSVSQMSLLLHLLLSFLSPNVGPAVPASCSSGFPVVAFPPQLSIFTGERRSPKSSHQPANQTEI